MADLRPRTQEAIAEFREREARWSGATDQLLLGRLTLAEYAARLPLQQALYAQANEVGVTLGHLIGEEAALRRSRIAGLTQLGTSLSVLLSLLAIGSAWITVRASRHLRRSEQAALRRAEEEAALREVARALTASVGIDQLLQRITDGAMFAAHAQGAFVGRADFERNAVEVVARSGRGAPGIGTRSPYPGSLAEEVISRGEHELIPDLAAADRAISRHMATGEAPVSALVLPLISEGDALGALFVLRGADQPPFDPETIGRARILSDLAAVALRRVFLFQGMESARREADAANRAKSQFLATMSHEIRTPINAVTGYTDLLEAGVGGPMTERQAEYVERIRGSSRHLATLINDILDLSKIEAGEMAVRREPVPLDRAITDALAMVEPIIRAKGLTLSGPTGCDDGIAFLGDEDRVRQVLVNLLSNAAKFTAPGGEIRVRCTLRPRGRADVAPQSPGAWLVVEVEDTGIGIAPEHAVRIFDPFYQAEGGYTRARGGTGLGLAISRTLARMMGGDVTVRSEVGVGSCFTLCLLPAPHRDGNS